MHDDLIKRLEEADGPSRELDAEIARAFGWSEVDQGFMNKNGSTEVTTLWRAPSVSHASWKRYVDELRPEIASGFWPDSEAPSYTSSIDAALTLSSQPLTDLMAAIFLCEQDGKSIDDLPRYAVVAALRAIEEGEG